MILYLLGMFDGVSFAVNVIYIQDASEISLLIFISVSRNYFFFFVFFFFS